MIRILAFVFTMLFSSVVVAQYNGPAVEACRAHALKELQRDGAKTATVVIERDENLRLERHARKIGNQSVSFILTGNGAVVYENAPSAELSFLCMLADEKRPVFFIWQSHANAPAMPQCVRSEELRANLASCLELLQRTAEQDLSLVYAHRFQEANERGEQSLAAYRKSNDEWRQYRDAECTRRRELAPPGVTPEDHHAACFIELTRRRALDMR